jgi:hypothetical protein
VTRSPALLLALCAAAGCSAIIDPGRPQGTPGLDMSRSGPPACRDGVRDGDESDVDCGGSCAACPDGKSCNGPLDCVSGLCAGAGGELGGGVCQSPPPGPDMGEAADLSQPSWPPPDLAENFPSDMAAKLPSDMAAKPPSDMAKPVQDLAQPPDLLGCGPNRGPGVLCSPCTTAADCMQCLHCNTIDHYCSPLCNTNADCPAGYFCQTICRPISGTCM